MAIVNLANALSERNFDVEILCTYHIGEPAYPLKSNITLRYLTKEKPNKTEFKRALQKKNPFLLLKESIHAVRILYHKKKTMKNALSQIENGVVISTRNEHSLLLSKFGKPGVLKVAQLHNDHQFNKKLISSIQRGYQNIDYLLLLTSKACREIESFLEGYNNKTKCLNIPNFINPVKFSSPIQKKYQVIAAGRLHSDKDFFCLLRIWSRIAPQYPNLMLKIVGEGELEDSLKSQASQLGISKQVLFTGVLSHDLLMAEMAQSICYLLTSRMESFGLVLVESMSCGTVPISFDVRVGPGEIIEDGISGFLVPERNEDIFSERIVQLLSDSSLRQKMEMAAKKRAEYFYEDRVLQQWLALLQQ